jgi:hypothetical protein
MHLHLTFSGVGVYTFPQGTAGAMSFHDPLEGTEINPHQAFLLARVSMMIEWESPQG